MRKLSKTEIILLVGAPVFNFLEYFCGRMIAQGMVHYDITTSFDKMIPLITWTVLIYWIFAYPLWVVNYCLGVYYEKGGLHRFIMAHYFGETICFLIFILFPTIMVRPEITGTSFFDKLLVLTYQIDSPDNLIPSIHCFASWMCWIAVRKSPHIPGWYQVVSFIIAAAICISTLTVKQHVIADVITGILLAELSYFAAGYVSSRLQKKQKDLLSDQQD